MSNLPNLTAVSRHISGGNPVVSQQCYQYGVALLELLLSDYFSQTVMGTLNGQVEIFKAARLFSPHQICYLRPVANDIDAVAAIPFSMIPLSLETSRTSYRDTWRRQTELRLMLTQLVGGRIMQMSCPFGQQQLS